MGWLGRGALVASVISMAACMPPEPPRDAGPPGPGPDDATVLEVPVDVLIADDATTFLNEPSFPPVDGGCAPAR
jgi:hypothetical protein